MVECCVVSATREGREPTTAVVTLRSWPAGEGDDADVDRIFRSAAAVAIGMLVCLMVLGTELVRAITGAERPAVDPEHTVTYHGQVFAHFQPGDELSSGKGVAEEIRGTPVITDQLWNLIPPRAQITVNGITYGNCEGRPPVMMAHVNYRELVCHRLHPS